MEMTDASTGHEEDRFWQASYAPGVAGDIDFGGHSSALELFAASVRKWPDRIAVSCLGTSISYRELDSHCRRLAAGFRQLGLRPGARVALMMPSTPQYLACQLALMRAGLVAVNVNPLYTPREVLHQLRDSGSRTIVVLENFASTIAIVNKEFPLTNVVVSTIGDLLGPLKGFLANAVSRHVRKAVPPWRLPGHYRLRDLMRTRQEAAMERPAPDDVAMLQYTGGTTGMAKGAMLSHRNLLAASLQSGAFLQAALQCPPTVDAPVLLVPLPLYHVFTICVALMGLGCGARVVLVPNPRDISGLIKVMRSLPFHLMTGLNTLYRALADHPSITEVDFTTCRAFVAGGAATQTAVGERWQALTGRWIVEGWGMSETAGAGTCNPPWQSGASRGVGLPLPSTRLSIRDREGQPVAAGESGEICISGPQVMAGYWGRQDDSNDTFWPDGFLRTGDIGKIEADGFVHIVDRLKDMALVSGFNVYPAEIENAVALHPDVAEAAAVAVPDRRTGEAIKLFVVRRDPSLTAESVLSHCSAMLTAYKRPREVVFVEVLPKSTVGKVLRRELPVD